ncbi:MAG TPA: D-alanyl-D-alanine carboxypeptidase/D-alanyl-D-alanine-endopeptidase [Acidimicrobiales bacterium]|nr:D-alanyl-D-alanine carboxypeptidase/D-alanyl-D-alanine-endopeptidase [Acidimicrobiales bacterium]
MRLGGLAQRRRLVALVVALAAVTGAGGIAVGRVTHDRPDAAPRRTTTSSRPAPVETQLSPEDEAGAMALSAALGPLWARDPNGCIAVASRGRVVYAENADAPVEAASVLKLATAVAALDVIGADTRLSTTVVAATAPTDGVAAGDLWLVGGGDPVLGTSLWGTRSLEPEPVFTPLDSLADRVVAAGVRQIGRVVGDDSRYDDKRVVDTWPHRFVDDGEIGPLSALTVNDGFRTWSHPGVAFDDPAVGAASVFTDLLRARGVTVDGAPTRGAAGRGVTLAALESAPVGDLVEWMLRDSDNGTAELLTKEIGLRRVGVGSTAAGVKATTDALTARGLRLDGTLVADGSGLSDANRLTCRLVTSLLVAAQTLLAPRLAEAGRTGTLATRFRGTSAEGRLRAKTGSVDGVAAIAGYLDRPNGAPVTFSYVINGLAPKSSLGHSLQDAFVLALLATSP